MAVAAEKRLDDLEDRIKVWEKSNAENKIKATELDQTLGVFIVHTERALNRLAWEMKIFRDEMKDFKDEMKDFKDEMKSSTKELNKRWGDLANKMGTMVEDIVAPSIPRIAKDVFGCDEIEDFMVRRWRRQPDDASKRKEFDLIAVCRDKVVFVEVKETLRQNYLEDFADFIKNREFFAYFPEYNDKTLLPVFGSLYLPAEAINFLSKRNIYAMTMNDNVVQILNPEIGPVQV